MDEIESLVTIEMPSGLMPTFNDIEEVFARFLAS